MTAKSIFPIKLTVEQIVENGLAAIEARRVTALTSKGGSSEGCVYRNRRGVPCIIGASFTDEQAAAIKARKIDGHSANRAYITRLCDVGLVSITGGALGYDGYYFASKIQGYHDAAVQTGPGSVDFDILKKTLEKARAELGLAVAV